MDVTGVKRRKAFLAIALAGLALALIAAGCGGGGGSSEESTGEGGGEAGKVTNTTAEFPDLAALGPQGVKPATKPVQIPIMIPGTQLLLQKAFVAGAEAAAEELNVKARVYDAGGFENVAAQVSQFENALATKPDAIVGVPSSPEALNSQIEQAQGDGIPVLLSLIPPSVPVEYSIIDPLPENGARSVEAVAELLGEEGNLYLIDGGAGGLPDSLFTEGVKKALKKFPKMKLVFESHQPGFDPAEAQKAVSDAFVKEPEVDAIITNQSNLAIAAYETLEREGVTPITTGYGPNAKEEIPAIREGKLSVAIAEPFYAMGRLTMEWAVAILAGEKPAEPVVPAPPLVLTEGNIDEAISSGALFESINEEVLGCGPNQSEEC